MNDQNLEPTIVKEQLPFDNDDLEKLLREKSDEFLLYPNRKVWQGIYNNVHPGKKWPSISISILLLATLYLVGYLNTNQTESELNYSTATHQNDVQAAAVSKTWISNEASSNPKLDDRINGKLEAIAGNLHAGNLKSVVRTDNGSKNQSVSSVESRLYSPKTYPALPQTISRSNSSVISKSSELGTVTERIENAEQNSTQKREIQIKTNTKLLNTSVSIAIISGSSTVETDSDLIIPANQQMQVAKKTPEVLSLDVKKESGALEGNESSSNLLVQSTFQQPEVPENPNKTTSESFENTLSLNEKIWMEHDILYNRAIPKKWKGKLEKEWYFTPSVAIGQLTEKSRDLTLDAQASLYAEAIPSLNQAVSKSPSLGAEVGFGLRYAIHPKLRLKGALQLNFTQYSINAYDNAHPSATSITLIDNRSALPYEVFKSTNYSNLAGIHPVKLHNNSFQFSLPVGADYRIWTNGKLNWYAGMTLQPSIVLIGHNYLLSSDKRSFIYDNSLQNRFNLHAGLETFISYERNGYTWQIGPRFRSQIFTTNTRLYPIEEKIQNIGIKIGLSKRL